jgi:hypothetical protein
MGWSCDARARVPAFGVQSFEGKPQFYKQKQKQLVFPITLESHYHIINF